MLGGVGVCGSSTISGTSGTGGTGSLDFFTDSIGFGVCGSSGTDITDKSGIGGPGSSLGGVPISGTSGI